MRWIINILIVVGIGVVLGIILMSRHQDQSYNKQILVVQESLAQLKTKALFHASLGDVELSDNGYASVIKSQWFKNVPKNTMVDDHFPWLDIAQEDELEMSHPENLTCKQQEAGFWYNPKCGILRARVPEQDSQKTTQELYAKVNNVNTQMAHR